MTVERVYLIRHGRTAWNLEGRWQGLESLPLDDVGFSQARALAAHWQHPLTAIYSSDLLRAWQTATPLAEALGLTPVTDERLRECNLGIFQGLTKLEMQAKHPHEYNQMIADYMGYCIPSGETRRDLQALAYAAFLDITATATGHIAIISHGGTLQVLMYRLIGETEQTTNAHYGNTSITTVERDGAGWRLVELAATPHFAASGNPDPDQLSEHWRVT